MALLLCCVAGLALLCLASFLVNSQGDRPTNPSTTSLPHKRLSDAPTVEVDVVEAADVVVAEVVADQLLTPR